MRPVLLLSLLTVCFSFTPQKFAPLDAHQKKLEGLLKSDTTQILCVTGAAGTGKTFLSCQEAITQLKQGRKNKVIITRPLVHVENEELGFLPGTMNEKMLPWTLPIFDNMKEFIDTQELKKLIHEGRIEISPLGYMRGRTFKNSFIILDEAQNTSPTQMKMFLTRIGNSSKIVLNGDLHQSDVGSRINGYADFLHRLQSMYLDKEHAMYQDGFGIVNLDSKNTYRHPIIKKVNDVFSQKDFTETL